MENMSDIEGISLPFLNVPKLVMGSQHSEQNVFMSCQVFLVNCSVYRLLTYCKVMVWDSRCSSNEQPLLKTRSAHLAWKLDVGFKPSSQLHFLLFWALKND